MDPLVLGLAAFSAACLLVFVHLPNVVFQLRASCAIMSCRKPPTAIFCAIFLFIARLSEVPKSGFDCMSFLSSLGRVDKVPAPKAC